MNLALISLISIGVDWEFTNSSSFKSKDDIQRRNMIIAFDKVIYKGLFDKNKGLVTLLKQLEVGKQEFIQKVKKIILKYKKMNSNTEYIEIEYSNQNLYVLVSENYYDITSGWGYNVETALDLNIKNRIYVNETLENIKEIENKFNSSFCSYVNFKVDYSFINHLSFKSQDEIQRRNTILAFERIYNKGLYDRDNGLIENLKLSSRGTKKFMNLVDTIVLVPKEANEVETDDNYFITKYDKNTKTLNVLLKKNYLDITNGFFRKVEKELDLAIKDEIYIRECEEAIYKIEMDLISHSINLYIQVNWDYTVKSQEYKKKDERERMNIIDSVRRAINRGFYDKEKGIFYFLSISKRFSVYLQNKVKFFVVSLVPSSSVKHKFGNAYYSVSWNEPNFHIDINQNLIDLTDGWGYKIDQELDIHSREEVEMRNVEKIILDYENKISNILHRPFYIEINWKSLIDEKWKQQDFIHKRNNISQIDNIIHRGKLIESLEKDEKLKEIFKISVGKVLIDFSMELKEEYFSIHFSKGTLTVMIKTQLMEITKEWTPKINLILKDVELFKDELPLKGEPFEFCVDPQLALKYQILDKETKCELLKEYKEAPKEDNTIHIEKQKDSINIETPKPDIKLEVPSLESISVEKTNDPQIGTTKESLKITSRLMEDIKERRREVEIKSLKSFTNQESSPLFKYKIIKVLGKGAFGKVYLCQKKNSKFVALKEMLCDKIDDSNNYLNECLRGMKLTHPNIVKYNDAFNIIDDDDNFKTFIEMNYYSLGDLNEFVKDFQLNEEQIIDFSIQILNGIEFIHENELIHRDLKPANIVLSIENDEINLAICDFGSTKSQGSIRIGSIAGTLNFIAPEIMTESEYNEKCDIFSFGAIFYYLLTKREKYFYAIILKNSMRDVKDEVAKLKLQHLNEFQEILFSCLEMDQNKRPSAKELKNLFKKIKS